ncbi:MAG TPA: endonuclease domain-containing protein [Acetobacteraceae bacterium]|nr:endonuclease domain-containing protein [Acetobacteraceae bacterium]
MTQPHRPPPLAGGGWGEGTKQPAKTSLIAHAKTTRRAATPAERRLWQALRKHQLGGLQFRRQMPLGPFIADFYCPTARLVVEVDGVSHIDSPTDASRDVWIRDQGIRVFRVTNLDVLSNLHGVLIAIRQAAQPTPPPNPLPQGEGE